MNELNAAERCGCNTAYLRTISAGLKMGEMFLALIIILIILAGGEECLCESASFLEMTSFSFLVFTSVHFIAVLVRPASEQYVNSPIGLVFHVIAVFLYLCGTLATLVHCRGRGYAIAAGAMAIFNTILYAADAAFIWKGGGDKALKTLFPFAN